jgi:hypothetical protein
MEVHHPHHPTHKKKWSEYILEFFMLFVAVTLGFFAENIREHYVEKHKAIVNVQNLYKDLKTDSIVFSYMLKVREKQDSCFQIISGLYDQKKIEQDISTLYVAQSFLAMRIMPFVSTMALDQLKSSGALNYIEDETLKQEIQLYANNAVNLKVREQREYAFIDKNIDPLIINRFEYKYYHDLSIEEDFEIKGDKILARAKIPEGLKLINQSTFDWNNYFSILSTLSLIRTATNRYQIMPAQEECNKLIELVKVYLKENNALIDLDKK